MISVTIRTFIFIICSSFFLLACGGGSGGESNPNNPPPTNNDGGSSTPPPTDPSTNYTLEISEDNADVIVHGISFSESLLQFSRSVVQQVNRFTQDTTTISTSCPIRNDVEGTVSISLDEETRNFRLDEGDIVTVNFVDCYDVVMKSHLTGSISFNVSRYTTNHEDYYELEGEVRAENLIVKDLTDDFELTVHAFYELTFLHNVDELLTVRSNDNQYFSVNLLDLEEKSDNFELSKRTLFEETRQEFFGPFNEIMFDIMIESDVYAGNFHCQSDLILFTSPTPSTSDITCQGNNSSVSISNINVNLTTGNETSLLGTIIWSDVIEGFFHEDFSVEHGIPRLDVGKYALKAINAAYDELHDRAIIHTAMDDPVFPNSIVEYRSQTHQFTPLFAAEKPLKNVVIAGTGEKYCFSYVDETTLICKNGDTNVTEFELDVELDREVHADATYVEPLQITHIVPSPYDSDTFVVKLRGFYSTEQSQFDFIGLNYLLINNGQQLPNSLNDLDHVPGNQDNNDLFWFAKNNGAFMLNNMKVDIDGNGFSSAINTSFLTDGEHHFLDQDRVVVGQAIYDTQTLQKQGTFQNIKQFNSYLFGGFTNKSQKRQFFFTNLNDGWNLISFDTETFVARNKVRWNSFDDQLLLAALSTKQEIMILAEDTLFIVPVESFQSTPDIATECLFEEVETSVDKLSCKINFVISDPVRNKVYATTPGYLGENGNKLLVINPATRQIEDELFVGSNPNEMAISGDGNILNILLEGANKVVRLNLNNFQFMEEITQPLEIFERIRSEDLLHARKLMKLAVSPLAPDTLAIGSIDNRFGSPEDYEVKIYSSGEPFAQATSHPSTDALIFVNNETVLTSVSNSSGGSITEFQVTDNELIDLGRVATEGFSRYAQIHDNFIYDTTGTRFPITSYEEEGFVDLGNKHFGRSLQVNTASNEVFYIFHDVNQGFGFSIQAYDLLTGAHTGTFDLNRGNLNGAFRFIRSSFLTQTGEIGLNTEHQELIILHESLLQ